MSIPFKIRLLDNRGDLPADKVGLEIIASIETEKRVFVILDFSDSCTLASQALKKLSWVWQRIPQHWQVTIFAISNSQSLYPEAGSMFSRDLKAFLCDIETHHLWRQWIEDQAKRGSFFQPTLDGIEEVFLSERAIDSTSPSEAIAIVVSDGEMLDPDPIKIPTWLTGVVILCQQSEENANSSFRFASGFAFFDLGSTELDSCVTGLICPAMTLCDVVPNFECALMESGAIHPVKSKLLRWNFADGPLSLLIDANVLGTSGFFLDVKLSKKDKCRLDLSGLSIPEGRHDGLDPESATTANNGFFIFDDPVVVQEILLDLRKSAANRESISQQSISLILSRFMNEAEFENALIVNIAEESLNPILFLAKLFKDPKRSFFMNGSSNIANDPGFAPRYNLFVQYNEDAARWYLIHGGERKTLAPRVCGSLQNIFFDSKCAECEAFYTGPLKLK